MAFGKYAVDYEQRINYDRLRKERLQRAKQQMEKDGLGGILTFDPANIRYLTSYYVTTPMRMVEMQCVFIAKNGEPYLFGGGTPSETERRMSWMEGRVNPSLGAPKLASRNVQGLVIGRMTERIAKLMLEHGVEKEPIGVDGTTLQALYVEAFNKKGIKAINGKSTMDEARLIKTQDEVELMRITCANSERAFAAIVDAIKPGIRECDLVGIGIKALYEEGVDHTEDLVCCSGYNTNPFGWSFTDKPIRPGDLIYIDVDGASYQGYLSCVYRTFCCGKATQEQKDLYEECRAMLYDGISAVKAGNNTHDIADKWPDSPKYWGYDTWGEVGPYAVGHGIGLTLHDPPLISRGFKEAGMPPIELKDGMVLALETWTGKKGGKDGVRLEEDVLVTKNGAEILTRWPIEELMECWLPYK
jgi:Xaa-Pro dipeptidase